jgi:mycoredoxin
MVEDGINIDVRRDSSRMTASVTTQVTSSVTMYSTPWCGYCHRLQGQMDREGIEYDVVDIEQHPEAAAFVESVNNGNQTVPTLVYSDGSAQTNPSVMQVKEKLATLES